ncbi:hypothetical protein GQ53DRAFT_817002 [Thozetella sp. PMI_491]|nr:hypothetical protein GQ53DRAFT_817002 [Thozetella sp. PMI_491]
MASRIFRTGGSAGALVAVVVILKRYDGQLSPDWWNISFQHLHFGAGDGVEDGGVVCNSKRPQSAEMELFKGRIWIEDANQGVIIDNLGSDSANSGRRAVYYANFTNTTCPTPTDQVAYGFRALVFGATKAVRDATFLASSNEPLG